MNLIGIVTNGLVGHQILAKFNLGWFGITVTVTPTPTPSPTPTATPSPTATPVGHGGAIDRDSKIVIITVRIGDKQKTKNYIVDEKTANIIVKHISLINKIIQSVEVNFRKISLTLNKIFVRIKKDDR